MSDLGGQSECSSCGTDLGWNTVEYACESCFNTRVGNKPQKDWKEFPEPGKNYKSPCQFCLQCSNAAKWQQNATLCYSCHSREEKNALNRLDFLRQLDPSPLSKDFKGDISFIVEGSPPIQAHRFILAGKSPVFRKMLEVEMRENISGNIHIEGTSAPVLRAVVNYLYTAEVTFSEEVPPLEVFSFSHRYDIPWLKEECGSALAKTISTQNISEMLRLSYRFEAEILKKEARKFFEEHPAIHLSVLDDLLKDL
ncbi:unnamed protein product [Calypogeia fissa]